jgi:hypothetical protein
MTEIPEDFLADDDPFTEEDGVGDNVDRRLPEIDPDDYLDTPETP